MIPYDEEDQRAYYAERSYWVTSILGMTPTLITEENYETVRQMIMGTLTGSNVRRTINQASAILAFATTFGWGDPDA